MAGILVPHLDFNRFVPMQAYACMSHCFLPYKKKRIVCLADITKLNYREFMLKNAKFLSLMSISVLFHTRFLVYQNCVAGQVVLDILYSY